MKTATFQDVRLQSLLENHHIEPFLNHLRAAGYAESTLRKKRSVTRTIARWMKRKRITTDNLNESHIDAFVARSPRRRKDHAKFDLAVMRLFFRYLRSVAGLQGPPVQKDISAGDGLIRRYKDYLRNDRGLAEKLGSCLRPFHPRFARLPIHANGRRVHGGN